MTTESRTFPRFEAYLDAELDTGWIRASATVLSLSERGLFTATDVPLGAGTRLSLLFELPDRRSVRVVGKVVYRGERHHRQGVGVRLVSEEATSEGMGQLARWCRRAAPIREPDLSQFSSVSLY